MNCTVNEEVIIYTVTLPINIHLLSDESYNLHTATYTS